MNIQTIRKLLWATLISAILMFFLLINIDWKDFDLIIGRLDPKYLIFSCCVFLFGNLVRSFRFIQLDHTDKKLSQWWNINAFYNFTTATLPGGSGEAATAYILKRFLNFNIFGALRILLFSRLLDIFSLSALFFITSVMVHSDTAYREAAIWISGTLFLISSVTIMRSSEQLIIRLLQKLPQNNPLMKNLSENLSELITISEEQRAKGSFGLILFQSIVMWIGAILLTHMLLRSFGVDFTLIQSAYCFGIYSIFQIIPIQGIAGIGTQAAWWALALNVAGHKSPEIVALSIVLHGTFYVFILILAISSLITWLIRQY